MHSGRVGRGVEFDHVVRPVVSVRKRAKPAAQCAGTDDRDLTTSSEPEAFINEGRLMLVAVQSDAESTVNQHLKRICVHIVVSMWTTSRVVMPHGKWDVTLVAQRLNLSCRRCNRVGVDTSGPMKWIIVVTTVERSDYEIVRRIRKHVELVFWCKAVAPAPLIESAV